MPSPRPFKTTSLNDLTDPEKIQLLELLEEGYGYDGTHVTQHGAPYIDPYSGLQVSLAEIAIMPGSAIVIRNEPVSIAGYVADYLTH